MGDDLGGSFFCRGSSPQPHTYHYNLRLASIKDSLRRCASLTPPPLQLSLPVRGSGGLPLFIKTQVIFCCWRRLNSGRQFFTLLYINTSDILNHLFLIQKVVGW